MKKSQSQLMLEALLRQDSDEGDDDDHRGRPEGLEDLLHPGALGFDFVHQSWPQNPPLKHSGSVSATIDSQSSSICVGTPTLAVKPIIGDNQALGGSSGSEQSDDESLEIEGGPCEQSNKVVDIKRMRRMVSNRESARRSRKRKQAHLADLEQQVDQLRGENSSLFKQLTDANQEFTEAVTNNRILKSDVETLRVKVKMAEDMIAGGTIASSLEHLLQSHIGSSPPFLSTRQPCRASSDVLPIMDFQGDDPYIAMHTPGQVQNIVLENSEAKSGDITTRFSQNSPLESITSLENLHARLSNEAANCGASDIWTWDSCTSAISK